MTTDQGAAEIETAALAEGDSPRLDGLDTDHVRQLAERAETMPPLLVHRATLRVIDGHHRLAAARLRGLDRVPVRWFEGSDAEAFVAVVRSTPAVSRPAAPRISSGPTVKRARFPMPRSPSPPAETCAWCCAAPTPIPATW